MAARRLRLDRTLGPLVARWIETNLVHGPGDVQGQPIELDDEQLRFLFRAYELDDRGRRLVRRAVFSRPKGRAKSELAAMIVCAEALGPVRFAGWDHDGNPSGRPVTAPYIPIAATEEGQAGDTYAAAEFMLREGAVSATPGLDVGQTRTFLPAGGKIQPISARASSKEGGRETHAVFDETHLYVTDELVRLHATIRRNLGKRKAAEPWSLEVSTMYAPHEGSVAERSHDYAKALLEGVIRDQGFLFDHREAPPDFDFDDDEQLRAALTEAYGAAAEWMDLERLLAEARDPQTSRADFQRYFLNQATARDDAWLPTGAWDACYEDRDIPDGAEVVLGFDGSYNRDSTALVGILNSPRPHVFVVAVWERPAKATDWVVPRDQVHAEVERAFQRWWVRELVGDRAKWFDEFEAWSMRYGAPPVLDFPQTRKRMAEACAHFYGAVVNREITHDGDERLARHIANAVTKETPDGAYITKDGRNSPRKVDLAVAAVMGFQRASVPQPESYLL